MTGTQLYNLRSLLADTEQYCIEHNILPWALCFVPALDGPDGPDRLAVIERVPNSMLTTHLRWLAGQIEGGTALVRVINISHHTEASGD